MNWQRQRYRKYIYIYIIIYIILYIIYIFYILLIDIWLIYFFFEMLGFRSTLLVLFSLTAIAFFLVLFIWPHVSRSPLLYNYSHTIVTMVWLINFSNALGVEFRTRVNILLRWDLSRNYLTALPVIYCCKVLHATYFQGSIIHLWYLFRIIISKLIVLRYILRYYYYYHYYITLLLLSSSKNQHLLQHREFSFILRDLRHLQYDICSMSNVNCKQCLVQELW